MEQVLKINCNLKNEELTDRRKRAVYFIGLFSLVSSSQLYCSPDKHRLDFLELFKDEPWLNGLRKDFRDEYSWLNQNILSQGNFAGVSACLFEEKNDRLIEMCLLDDLFFVMDAENSFQEKRRAAQTQRRKWQDLAKTWHAAAEQLLPDAYESHLEVWNAANMMNKCALCCEQEEDALTEACQYFWKAKEQLLGLLTDPDKIWSYPFLKLAPQDRQIVFDLRKIAASEHKRKSCDFFSLSSKEDELMTAWRNQQMKVTTAMFEVNPLIDQVEAKMPELRTH